MRLNLAFISSTLGCTQHPDGFVTSVAIDSRKVQAHSLFVCIKGEHTDGHAFVQQAVEGGAVAIIAEKPVTAKVPVFVVKDSIKALGRLARAVRDTSQAKVIGITGTAGKTTIKEMLAQVLALQGITAKNELSFNNQLGLPLSILNAADDAVFWVMEMGISHPHDMDELGEILRPHVGLILNVGAAHTEGLGDFGVAHYKARLLDHIVPDGLAVVSADYPDLLQEARSRSVNKVFFSGTEQPAEYRAFFEQSVEDRSGLFTVCLNHECIKIKAPLQGEIGAENIAAVAAVAHGLGLSSEQIVAGFAGMSMPKMRFSCSTCGAWQVINDTYNANPLSMERTLKLAAHMAKSDPLVCVLGEMRELGSISAIEHEKLGCQVGKHNAAVFLWKGAHADDVQAGLSKSGFTGYFAAIKDSDDMLQHLRTSKVCNGTILFKGSRSNQLEEQVLAFTQSLGSY